MWLPVFLLLQGGCIPVAGDRILAADLAPFAGPFRGIDGNTFVAYAPLPGLERRLTRRELGAVVRGIPRADLPESLCVVRAASRLEAAGIAAVLRPLLPKDAELEILRVPDGRLPAGRIEFSLSGLRRFAPPDRYQWKGRIVPHGGGRSVAIVAEVRLRLRRPVLVARQRMEAGTVIEPSLLALEVRDVGVPVPPDAPDPGSLGGWRTRRTLEAGEPVAVRDLIPPAGARAGETIVLTAKARGMTITVEGRALTAGRIGDRILVESLWNGKRIEARLIGAGRAVAERIAR